MYTHGTIAVTADGYGTLILPYGTFPNAIRIHIVENYQDSVIGVFGVHATYASDDYVWYVPGVRMEVLTLDRDTVSGHVSNLAYYTKLAPLEADKIAGIEAFLKIFPNPAKDELQVRFSLPETEEVHIGLWDVMGREVGNVAGGAYAAGEHEAKCDIHALPAGLYLLKLQSGQETITRKVQVP
jgi:hypothetical protein